ncbi:helix-turn-helix domain-containing protein [Pantoea sp. PSNIH4]|nr:DNA-binding protein [Pantoea sp. PSNIH2]POU48629.1 helix-turn-helix domain-containing protein [Pantoea sp. PSNIH5]POU66349.1 helix-turn-helix domain-containing protein [Pantoea sp. PSNIH4]POY68400.1 helix-turn-helix domain-containing protein [Pantoea sp. PSNIH3]
MTMKTIGDRLRARRKELRLTQKDLASRVGVSHVAISQWEKDETAPRGDNLLRLSEALGCAPAYLHTGDGAATNVAPGSIDFRAVPVISYVQAGYWTAECTIRSIEGDIEFLHTNMELSDSAFSLIIKGNSMEPDFREGDAVVIDPEVIPLPGDFVVAKNGEEEALFKKYRPRGVIAGQEVFELVPLNEDYPTLRSDQVPIRIIGTMIEHRRYRKRRS